MRNFVKKLLSKIRAVFPAVPESYSKLFRKHLIMLNMRRLYYGYICAFLTTPLTAYLDYKLKSGGVCDSYGSYCSNLIVSRVLIVIIEISYIIIYLRMRNRPETMAARIFLIIYTFLGFGYFNFIAINAQLAHGSINAYIIGCFAIASFIILPWQKALLLFGAQHAIFIAGIYALQADHFKGVISIVNASVNVSFALMVSVIVYRFSVTEIIQNKKLEEVNSRLSTFFTNISHEIRTPLTLIISPVESVIQGNYKGALGADFFSSIWRNAKRLLSLINDLLDFSKIESGHMSLRVQEADMVSYMKKYLSSIQATCDARGLALKFSSDKKSIMIFADPAMLDKILMNLFSNAIKFTERGGLISVDISSEEFRCCISISDTGIGILEGDLPYIYERFSQFGSPGSDVYSGTGIGLSLVKEFVELHGGSIEVESKHISEHVSDHGTLFKIFFPLGRSHFNNRPDVEFVSGGIDTSLVHDSASSFMHDICQDAGMAPIAVYKHATGAKRVLIVEDNPDMRRYLAASLGEHYTVYSAVDGADGLKAARETSPDIIVSDVMMPVMNGYDMAAAIKSDPDLKMIPVILLTAKAEVANRVKGLDTGAEGYLTKPFNIRELLAMVQSLLKAHEYERIISARNRIIENDLDVAKLIQRKLLPESVPSVPGFSLHAEYISMDKVGGDLYDFRSDGDYLTVFISDVVGHGLASSYLALVVKMSLEFISSETSTVAVLKYLNNALCNFAVKNGFVTAFLGRVDLKNKRIKYCKAGHHPPVVYRSSGDMFFDLQAKGVPLGWMEAIRLEENEFQLNSGDRIIIFTDGVIEGLSNEGGLFGDERLKNIIRAGAGDSPEKFSKKLLSEMRGYSGSDSFNDDVTFIVMDVE